MSAKFRFFSSIATFLQGRFVPSNKFGSGYPDPWKPKFSSSELSEIRSQPTKKLREQKVKELRAYHLSVEHPQPLC